MRLVGILGPRRWMGRWVLPLAAVVGFVILTSAYNAWNNVPLYNLFVRCATSTALGVVLFGWTGFLRWRGQAIWLSVISGVVAVLFIANAVYSGYAGGFLSASTLAYIWQAPDTAGSLGQLFRWWMLVFAAPAIGFGVIAIWGRRLPMRVRRCAQWGRRRRRDVAGAIIGLALLIVAGYGVAVTNELRHRGNLKQFTAQPYDSREMVRNLGIINYNLLDLGHYIFRKRHLSTQEVQYVEEHRSAILTPTTTNSYTGALKGKNVIFLQMESFQQFLVGLKVKGQEVTPNLNKLAAASRQFANFHYVVGPGTSSDAEFVTFNSLMPLANEAVVFDYPGNDYRAYPKLLKEDGYTTHAYHADSRTFWNRANTYPGFGFDEYAAEESYAPGKTIGFGLNDEDFYRQSLQKITNLRQPFYAHLISLSSHVPFQLDQADRELDVSGLGLDWIQEGYLQSAHYTDKALGEFLDQFGRSPLAGNTALVLMGDHEGFVFKQDDAVFPKLLGVGDAFTDLSYLHARTVPFLIYAPGTAVTPGIDDRAVSQIDIYPTLANLLGARKPEKVLGVDLLGAQTPTVVRRARGVGPSIESVVRGDMTYMAGSRQGGEACYQGAQKIAMTKCQDLKDYGVARALVSDYVIMGNRLDLL